MTTHFTVPVPVTVLCYETYLSYLKVQTEEGTGDLNAVSSSSSVVEGEVGHLFPAPTSQHNASPVIFVVPTTNNYLSYLGK